MIGVLRLWNKVNQATAYHRSPVKNVQFYQDNSSGQNLFSPLYAKQRRDATAGDNALNLRALDSITWFLCPWTVLRAS